MNICLLISVIIINGWDKDRRIAIYIDKLWYDNELFNIIIHSW